ncbi:hypothetical protein AYI70_g226 [Smittium culicis]|uniref:RING-type domain-containing protein n=1 Tax=Smittium culicis TaxID=133412 RepID=A0A1R1YHL8_9FUNG|nr:hypothetical protein AYI70_g226 [Smittium culicis]
MTNPSPKIARIRLKQNKNENDHFPQIIVENPMKKTADSSTITRHESLTDSDKETNTEIENHTHFSNLSLTKNKEPIPQAIAKKKSKKDSNLQKSKISSTKSKKNLLLVTSETSEGNKGVESNNDDFKPEKNKRKKQEKPNKKLNIDGSSENRLGSDFQSSNKSTQEDLEVKDDDGISPLPDSGNDLSRLENNRMNLIPVVKHAVNSNKEVSIYSRIVGKSIASKAESSEHGSDSISSNSCDSSDDFYNPDFAQTTGANMKESKRKKKNFKPNIQNENSKAGELANTSNQFQIDIPSSPETLNINSNNKRQLNKGSSKSGKNTATSATRNTRIRNAIASSSSISSSSSSSTSSISSSSSSSSISSSNGKRKTTNSKAINLGKSRDMNLISSSNKTIGMTIATDDVFKISINSRPGSRADKSIINGSSTSADSSKEISVAATAATSSSNKLAKPASHTITHSEHQSNTMARKTSKDREDNSKRSNNPLLIADNTPKSANKRRKNNATTSPELVNIDDEPEEVEIGNFTGSSSNTTNISNNMHNNFVATASQNIVVTNSTTASLDSSSPSSPLPANVINPETVSSTSDFTTGIPKTANSATLSSRDSSSANITIPSDTADENSASLVQSNKRRATFKCLICLEAPVNSVLNRNCGHVFCENCIMTYVLTSKKCPICRKIFTTKSLVSFQFCVKKIKMR